MKRFVVTLCVTAAASLSLGQVPPYGAIPAGMTATQMAAIIPPESANMAIAGLDAALGDISPRVRQAAVMALQEMGPAAKPAIPHIAQLMRDPDSFVRMDAGRTLVKLGTASVPSLVELLHDYDPEVREHSARALQYIDPPPTAAVPALTERLLDPASRVRQAAVITLQEMGPAAKPALPTIAFLFHDPDSYVRMDAAHTLVKLGPQSILVLVPLLTDYRYDVRERAAEALQRIVAESNLASFKRNEQP